MIEIGKGSGMQAFGTRLSFSILVSTFLSVFCAPGHTYTVHHSVIVSHPLFFSLFCNTFPMFAHNFNHPPPREKPSLRLPQREH